MQHLVESCGTVVWDGVLGVVECSAFQAGTRAVTSSLMQAHDDHGVVTIINGGTTAHWVRLFSGMQEASSKVRMPFGGCPLHRERGGRQVSE